MTAEAIRRFFEKTRQDFEKTDDLETLFNRPEAWWNVDETCFVFNSTPRKVYAARGARNVHNIERGKPKANVTCTYAVSADGTFIPPLVTFKESFSRMTEAAYVSGSKKDYLNMLYI